VVRGTRLLLLVERSSAQRSDFFVCFFALALGALFALVVRASMMRHSHKAWAFCPLHRLQ
jgi:hypothetical protein